MIIGEDYTAFCELIHEAFRAKAPFSAKEAAEVLGLERWEVFDALTHWVKYDSRPRLRDQDTGETFVFYFPP